MARSPPSPDAFSAIAEPRRRQILGVLARPRRGGDNECIRGSGGVERDVTWLATDLGWPQPQVSKHLGVLRRAGLVRVVRKGRHRVYTVNGEELRTIYDWVKTYERFWEHQLQRLKTRAEQLQRQSTSKHPQPPSPPSSPPPRSI